MIALTIQYIYRLYSAVHPLDVPVHLIQDVDGKPSCSTLQFQVQVVWGILCSTILQHVLTEGKYLAKKYQWRQDEI